MIVAAATQHKCKIVDLGIARDDEDEIRAVLDKALAADIDILLTSGGVSMGDRDFVKPYLQNRGQVYFDKVNYANLFLLHLMYLCLFRVETFFLIGWVGLTSQ